MNFFNLNYKSKKEYHKFCEEKFGEVSYFKKENGVVKFSCDNGSENFDWNLTEPRYNTVSFDTIYPKFKQHLREKRLENLLSK